MALIALKLHMLRRFTNTKYVAYFKGAYYIVLLNISKKKKPYIFFKPLHLYFFHQCISLTDLKSREKNNESWLSMKM